MIFLIQYHRFVWSIWIYLCGRKLQIQSYFRLQKRENKGAKEMQRETILMVFKVLFAFSTFIILLFSLKKKNFVFDFNESKLEKEWFSLDNKNYHLYLGSLRFCLWDVNTVFRIILV